MTLAIMDWMGWLSGAALLSLGLWLARPRPAVQQQRPRLGD
jgi:hypothetical protein